MPVIELQGGAPKRVVDTYYEELDHLALWPDMPEDYRQQVPENPLVRGMLVPENRLLFEKRNVAIGALIREGINRGLLVGNEAFRAIGFLAPSQMYHGSVVPPARLTEGRLLPHQSRWRDAQGTYKDGDPAVCFTPDREIAAFAAFFGFSRPGLEGEFRGYGLAPKPYGFELERRLWMMVSKAALDTTLGESATIYTKRATWLRLHEFDHPTRAPEYRSTEPIDYDFAVTVGSESLSPSLLVADGNAKILRKMWAAIMGGTHPLDLGSDYPPVTPLGEDWDIHDHYLYRSSSE